MPLPARGLLSAVTVSSRPRRRSGPLAALSLTVLVAGAAGATPGCLDLADQPERMEVHVGNCVTCHLVDWERTSMPSHDGIFPQTCADCHVTTAWIPARAVAHTWWPIRGAHVGKPCAACHLTWERDTTPTTCAGCHHDPARRDDYAATTMPPHEASRLPTDCATCHTEDAWVPSTFAHTPALTGAHVAAPCTGCHTGDPPRYAGTPTVCSECHMPDYDGATAPPHAGYPTDCASCHSTDAWRPSTFAHGTWPLDGAHARTACSRCHTGTPPVYLGTPRECVGCHRADYDGSPYPGHSSFPTACVDCHTTSAWRPALAGGHPDGVFPRTGPHAVACLDCHNPSLGSSVGGANTDCVGCHTGQHVRARVDAQHGEVGGYRFDPANPHFCLECHPDGRNRG